MPAIVEPKMIAGNANQPLAKAIARRMSMYRGTTVGLVDARVERFNDGEIFVEVFENVRGEDMFIIQPTSNPANDNLMELLIMAGTTPFKCGANYCSAAVFRVRPAGSPDQGAYADLGQTCREHAG